MSEIFWNRTLDVMQLFVLLVAAVILRKLGDEKLAATALGVAGGVAMSGGARQLGAVAQKVVPIVLVGCIGGLLLGCSATQIAAEQRIAATAVTVAKDVHAATVACGAKTYGDVKQAIHEGKAGIVDDLIALVGDGACVDAAIRAERSAHGGTLPVVEQVRADWLIKLARLLGVGPSSLLLPEAGLPGLHAAEGAVIPIDGSRRAIGWRVANACHLAIEGGDRARLPSVGEAVHFNEPSEGDSAGIRAPDVFACRDASLVSIVEVSNGGIRLREEQRAVPHGSEIVISDDKGRHQERQSDNRADQQRRACTFCLTQHEYFPQGGRYQKRRAARIPVLTAPGIL